MAVASPPKQKPATFSEAAAAARAHVKAGRRVPVALWQILDAELARLVDALPVEPRSPRR